MHISVVRVKVEDVNVVVYGRDTAASELQVYPRSDYISCLVEKVLSLDESQLDTELGEYDVYYRLPKKHISRGYSPIPDPADRRIGAMVEKWCSTGLTPTGKQSREKQVWTTYFLSTCALF
jgi:hypothetical protein